jgi:MYXO-CTERM domain-containing protein
MRRLMNAIFRNGLTATLSRSAHIAAAMILATLLGAAGARAQAVFGTNSGTFAYWLPTDAMTDLPFNAWGSTSAPWTPDTAITLPNGSIDGDGGVYTQADNYPSGTYVVSFTSPSPVTISAGGDFSGISNVQRSGTLETMTVTLNHDNGNILAGSSWLTTSGVTSSNPVSNFQVYQQGTTPASTTPAFQGLLNNYQAVRYMNNLNINNNTTLMTSNSIVPSGSNMGSNSYADIVKWSNAQSNLKDVMIEIPVNADSTYIASVAKTMSSLVSGKQVIVEYGNEDWNYTFTQAGWLQTQGAADSRVTASDDFTRNAQEAGLRAAAMMQTFDANYTGKASVAGFLGSQGSNTYYVDQEKSAISRVYGAGAVDSLFKYQGISFYPGDGLSGASSESALYSALESDLTRQTNNLTADVADAKASGLSEAVYEWSPNGYLTLGGVSASVIAAFRASADSKQLTLDTWNAIKNNIGANGIAFDFDVTGDGWSTQENSLAATEEEQLAVDQIAAGNLTVGSQTPEPACLSMLGLGGLALLRRRRKA